VLEQVLLAAEVNRHISFPPVNQLVYLMFRFMHPLQNCVFLRSVASLKDLPNDSIAEVAVAGRSNAGKSSAINTLANRNRLAHVSRTPGRTQLLNFFSLAPGKYLVDLPGYGYARAPLAVKSQWDGLLTPYLRDRPQLSGLLLIMDCRRPFTDIDARMIGWFSQSGKPVHILLSKSDKLSRQQSTRTLVQVRDHLATLPGAFSAQLFSSLKKVGIADAERALVNMLQVVDTQVTQAEQT